MFPTLDAAAARALGRRHRRRAGTAPRRRSTASTSSRSRTATRARTCCSRCGRLPPRYGLRPPQPSPRRLRGGRCSGLAGNLGVILSQVLRGVAEAVAAADGPGGGPALADALVRGARLGQQPVVQRGHDADRARGGRRTARQGRPTGIGGRSAGPPQERRDRLGGDRLGRDRLDTRLEEVAVVAADAARSAMHATTGQLPELARAGVVDAGGLGLYLVLDALAAVVSGRAPVAELPPAQVKRLDHQASRASTTSRGYEVTYLLDGANDERAAALRSALDEVGDAVAVAGDGAPGGTGTWTVHVHAEDIDTALQAGAMAGRPRDVRVVPLTAAGFGGPDDRVGRPGRGRGLGLLAPSAKPPSRRVPSRSGFPDTAEPDTRAGHSRAGTAEPDKERTQSRTAERPDAQHRAPRGCTRRGRAARRAVIVVCGGARRAAGPRGGGLRHRER